MTPFDGPLKKEPTDLFNYCTKYLSRNRSNDPIGVVSEGWRFPLVMSVLHKGSVGAALNEVTFIYKQPEDKPNQKVSLIGSFYPLYKSLPLEPVVYDDDATGFYYLTVILPIGKGFYYRFLVDGKDMPDPVNPQRTTLANGKEWSYFFTDYFNYTREFEEWELNLLYRLVEQIVPFQTDESQNFIKRFHEGRDRAEKEKMPIYRLDNSVGEVNYITNILAKEERHHLVDYKICLSIIDGMLRKLNPYTEPWMVSKEMINDLYDSIAGPGPIAGWDYKKYDSPQHFLKMLRRHCITGAFCHPRYGGNIGGTGWNYLKEKYTDKTPDGKKGASYFNWDRAIEKPLGKNGDYRG